MSDRTFEQLRRDAYKRRCSIVANGENPAECHFLVTPYERCVLLDRAPFVLPEMNMERTTFFGMPIAEARCGERQQRG